MTIQLAEITIPIAPTITLPDAPVINITEPTLTDPTGPIRAFTYQKYGSIVNSFFEDKIEALLTWSGDDTLLENQTSVAADEITLQLLQDQRKIFDNVAARGFLFLPGNSGADINGLERNAKFKIQESLLKSFAGISETAVSFIKYAMDAGTDHAIAQMDEEKRIVYANIEAVNTIFQSLLDMQKKRFEISQHQIDLYNNEIKATQTQEAQNKALTLNQSAEIKKERAKILNFDLDISKTYADNLQTITDNAKTLVTADGFLDDAITELMLVSQTQAIIDNYLAEIKEVHATLLSNSADIEKVAVDVDNYKRQAQITEQAIHESIEKINNEKQKLAMAYSDELDHLKAARNDISAFEDSLSSDDILGQKLLQEYKTVLDEHLISLQNEDVSLVEDARSDQAQAKAGASVDVYDARAQVKAWRESRADARTNSRHWLAAKIQDCKTKGQAMIEQARAKANGSMTLTHHITG